jgi:arylsulfatase A-like enzyme
MKHSFLLLLIIVLWRLFTSCSHDDNFPSKADSDSVNNVNVILIVGDDIGYEVLTCNGGQSYSTPNLDALAQNGMRFTECYSSPLCSPSRIMLLTGKYNFRNYYEWGVLNTNQVTIGNMLKNNGYKTYYAGKWQLNGGDASIRKFGFSNYLVWMPFAEKENSAGSRYKSPVLYTNGNYLPANTLSNKYGEDIFTDSIKSFILNNQQKKFFVYYAMVLAHEPFSPTPDNNDYAAWNGSKVSHSVPSYYSDMVKYMDKKIGELVNFLKQNQLEKNTVILYVGDNGTPSQIQSRFNGSIITGGKKTTTTYGTHVPLIIYWPGKVVPAVNNNLVCFPDFLPTLADITHSTISNQFYPVDGVSFYPQLLSDNSKARSSIFCSFLWDTIEDKKPVRWVQDTRYKLYDTLKNKYHAPGFYDMQNDIEELHPLSDDVLTQQQLAIKQNFRYVLDSLK